MGSLKSRKKGVRKLPSEKLKGKIELDETVTVAEGKIEDLAQELVKNGTAKDIAEAQSMVLRNPAHSGIRTQYEKKFHA